MAKDLLSIDPREFIWAQKYRPQTVKDMILPKTLKNKILRNIKKKEIPNYLLSGKNGSGKTSLSKAIVNDLGSEVLFINASLENGIDVIRNKVMTFVSTMTLSDAPKIVILDECLEENEKVRIGTVDNWVGVALKDLELGVDYDIVSYNEETGELENDRGRLISDRWDNVYNITLKNGCNIVVNDKHPILVESGNSKEWLSLDDGLDIGHIIVRDGVNSEIVNIEPLGVKKIRNLTVYKNHTFLTENGIVTHNCDHLTTNAQASLRSLIEQYSKNARFILTANYSSKIIAPLHSRCEVIDFGSLVNNEDTKKEMFVEIYNRVLKIFELEGVKFDTKDPKEAQVIFEVIKKEYPDIRSVLKILQSYTSGGELDAGDSVDSYNHLLNEIVELIKEAKYTEIRKWLGTHTDIDSITLMRHLYDTLYDQLADQSKPELVLILAKYMYQDAFVVDKVINTMACITEIFLNCNFVE